VLFLAIAVPKEQSPFLVFLTTMPCVVGINLGQEVEKRQKAKLRELQPEVWERWEKALNQTNLVARLLLRYPKMDW
jgi:hypothetical protein